MGDVINVEFSERVHAGVDETYRLIRAFVQIQDRSLREKIIAMAEAGSESSAAPADADPQGQDTPGT